MEILTSLGDRRCLLQSEALGLVLLESIQPLRQTGKLCLDHWKDPSCQSIAERAQRSLSVPQNLMKLSAITETLCQQMGIYLLVCAAQHQDE